MPRSPIPDIGDRHVCCRVSGGAASAIAAMRCLEWFGPNRVTLVNADTGSESPGNYELIRSLEIVSGLPVERLHQGMDIWDVFDLHGVMRLIHGGGACKASVELKQKPLDAFTRDHYAPEQVVVAVGLSADEKERQLRLTKRLRPYEVMYPLNAKPHLRGCQMVAELERYGLPKSTAYKMGYAHDNCNGGCVLAGQAQWAGLLDDNPKYFAYCEKREGAFFERTGFTMLRDRRGGDTKPYPLSQLRTDKAAGRVFRAAWRSVCGCMNEKPPPRL